MNTLTDLILLGKKEEGYIEKASAYNLDSKTGNKGSNNYTKYARDISAVGFMGCQAQAGCATFQFWLETKTFGIDKALELWNMTRANYVGYSCFATYNIFNAKGKIGKVPKLGALVIFTFSHMGRVIRIYTQNGVKYFDCLEGNTSSNLTDRNGGMVKIKKRRADDSTVKGFCYIDYTSISNTSTATPITTPKKSGWIREDAGWKYYLGNTGECVKNDWYWDGVGWCFFNGAGIAVHDDWYKYKNNWYYFGSDCYALKSSWLSYKKNDYYFDSDNIMASSCYVKSKDPNSKKYYWLNADGIYEPQWDTENPDLTKYRLAI